jgi:hypothetical protein
MPMIPPVAVVGKPLARLEAEGFIAGQHTLAGERFSHGMVTSAPFVLYLANRHEDEGRMARLISRIEGLEKGRWLDGDQVRTELEIPRRVIDAAFRVYGSRGDGICSNESNAVKYCALT